VAFDLSRMMRSAPSLLTLTACLMCSACGDGKTRKPTFPVEGKVFWQSEKKPAVHAQVIFHSLTDAKPESWPDGFPRGAVAADGSFKLSTYEPGDGAPAGEYAVLIRWPSAVAKDETQETRGEDRLEGQFSDPDNARWKKQVKPGDNDPKDFIFIIR
jgi:hypothetical protein